MIYKFINGIGDELEVTIEDGSAILSITQDNERLKMILEQDDLYDLIGALHSIQTKVKKYMHHG